METEEVEICREAFVFAQRNLKAIPQRRVISKVDVYKGSITVNQPIPTYNIKQVPEAVEVFKKLPGVVPTGIIEQVKNLKSPLHCIFIVGNDFDLIAGIASYIYYVHASGSFTHLSYSGYTDQEIISDLFSPSPPNEFRLEYYLRGRTLFISGLGNKHQSVFERLLGTFRALGLSNPYKKDFGFLVIGVEDVALIPQELTNLSDVIDSLEKQGAVKQTEAKIKYDQDRYILFTEGKHLQLTGDKKTLIQHLFDGRKDIKLLSGKIAEKKGKNKLQYKIGNCRKLITETNKVIMKEFGLKDFIRSEKSKSGFYQLTPKPKEGIFQGNIEVIQR
ncbi:MAG: hypothetical protein HYV59_09005 [Planctomycetes bacterium]|nr:hypothetical protein [Planctomycetota bacterium]